MKDKKDKILIIKWIEVKTKENPNFRKIQPLVVAVIYISTKIHL